MELRNLKVTWSLEETSPNGVVKEVQGECKSLLKNFASWLYSFMIGTPLTANMRDTTGAVITMTPKLGTLNTSSTNSLVSPPRFAAGTGNTAVSSNDYNLQTQVQSATNDVPFTTVAEGTSIVSQTLRQSFSASSSYTIREIGLFTTINGERDSGGGVWVADSKELLLIRDVLSTPFTTTTGSTLTIRFNFTWSPTATSYNRNTARLILGFLTAQNPTLIDASGASYTVPMTSWSSSSVYGPMGFATDNPIGVIRFGTSNTAVSLFDYSITPASTSGAIVPSILTNDTTKLQWATTGAGFFGGSYNIVEMGLDVGFADDTTPANPVIHRTLLTRSVFTQISVSNGDWINGRYVHEIAV